MFITNTDRQILTFNTGPPAGGTHWRIVVFVRTGSHWEMVLVDGVGQRLGAGFHKIAQRWQELFRATGMQLSRDIKHRSIVIQKDAAYVCAFVNVTTNELTPHMFRRSCGVIAATSMRILIDEAPNFEEHNPEYIEETLNAVNKQLFDIEEALNTIGSDNSDVEVM